MSKKLELNVLDAFRRVWGREPTKRTLGSAWVWVEVTQFKLKKYRARQRYSDGHIVYRWGRLVRAFDLGDGLIVFRDEHRQAHIAAMTPNNSRT